MRNYAATDVVNDNGSRASKDQRECADKFCDALLHRILRISHTPDSDVLLSAGLRSQERAQNEEFGRWCAECAVLQADHGEVTHERYGEVRYSASLGFEPRLRLFTWGNHLSARAKDSNKQH